MCWPRMARNCGRGGKLPGLVENGAGRLGAVALVVARVLVCPKAQDDRIAHARDDAFTELLVGIEAGQVNECCARCAQKCRDAMKKKMLQTWSPTLAPEVPERGDHAGGGERMALGRNVRKRIEADGTIGIAGVKVADTVGAFRRDAIRDRLGKVAVGVDDGDAFPGHDVVHGEVEERRALSGARLPHQVDVPLAIVSRETNVAPGRACNVSVR